MEDYWFAEDWSLPSHQFVCQDIYEHTRLEITGILTYLDGFYFLKLQCGNLMPYTSKNWSYIGQI